MKKKLLLSVVSVITALLVVMSCAAVYAAEEVVAKGEPDSVLDMDFVMTDGATQDEEPSQPEESDEVAFLSGDIDGNGVVDINDVTAYQLILSRQNKATAAFNKNGDTNTDGKKNIYDATVIQYFIAGVFRELPITADGYYARIIRP